MEVYVVDVFYDILDIFDDSAFCYKIFIETGFFSVEEFGACLLEACVEVLELELQRVGMRGKGVGGVAGIEEVGHLLVQFAGAEGVESLFDGVYLAVGLHVGFFHYFGQRVHEFLFAHVVP